MGILLLLAFAKMQEMASGSRAWQWALGYTLVQAGLEVFLSGAVVSGMWLGSLLLFVYVWGYFALLRRVSDTVFLWLIVYIGGAFGPMGLAFIA